MPNNPSHPAIQKKPNWNPVSNNPNTIPMSDNGRIRKMISGCRKFPKSMTRMIISMIMAKGKYLVNAAMASF